MSVYQKYYIDFESIKPQVIDAFAAIYGEKHRQTIERRLSNLHINTYITAKDLKRHMTTLEKEKQGELTIEFLKMQGMELTEEQKEELAQGNSYKLSDEQKAFLNMCFGEALYIPSDRSWGDFSAFLEDNQDEELSEWKKTIIDERKVKVLNMLGANVTVENYSEKIQDGSLEHILKRIESIKSDILSADKKYTIFEQQHSQELEEINRTRLKCMKLKDAQNREYLKEISGLLPKEEQEKIAEALQEMYLYYPSVYFDYGIEDESLVESFSQKAEEVLISGDEKEKSRIKQARIKFFKSKGIDLGDNYDDYLKSEDAQKTIPGVELADRIARIREKHVMQYLEQIITQTGSYQENKEEIDALNLVKRDEYCVESIQDRYICMCPNAARTENGLQLCTVVNIPVFKIPDGYRDVVLIHELGHAIETELLGATADELKFKSGFEYVTENVNTGYVRNAKRRDFEIMSEVIHQEIAMEVTDYLHSRGIYLVGEPDKEKTVGASTYERNYIMLQDFFEKYRQDILDARMHNEDFEAFMQKVSKENMKQLNELVKKYSQLPHYKIAFASEEGRTIPEMEERQKLLEQQRELMSRIKKTFEESSNPQDLLLASAIEVTEVSTRNGQINDAVGEINKAAKETKKIDQRGES